MVAAANLIQLGVPDQQAKRLGLTKSTKAGVGTTQAGAALITTNMTVATTVGGQTALLLPLVIEASGPIIIVNYSATAAVVFPQTGENINGGTANASVSIAQNTTRIFFKVSATQWVSFLSG